MTIGFTSFDRDLIIGGVTYLANTAIDPTSVSQDADSGAANFEAKGFISSDVITEVDLRAGKYTGEVVELFIADFQALTKTKTLVKGRVGEVKQNNLTWQMTVRTNSDILNQSIRQAIQPVCRWTKRLDDSRCGIDKATFAMSGAVTAIATTKQFTIDAPFTAHPEIFNWTSGGGYVIATTGLNAGFRLDVDFVSAGTTIGLLNTAPYAFTVGDTVIVYPGCDGTFTRCKGVFQNGDNWGGFPVDGNFFPSSVDLRS